MAEETFGARLRSARHAAGLSQSDLSDRCGIPKPTLSRYENDHVLPSLGTLHRLAQGLGIDQAILLPDSDAPTQLLATALEERGIHVRTTEEAARYAGIIADQLARERQQHLREAT